MTYYTKALFPFSLYTLHTPALGMRTREEALQKQRKQIIDLFLFKGNLDIAKEQARNCNKEEDMIIKKIVKELLITHPHLAL